MNGYAYLDKYGILHVLADKDIASKYSKNGKIVHTDLADEGGYINENGMNVYIEVKDTGVEFWHGKNRNKEENLTEPNFAGRYPRTYQIYKQLK